MLGCEVNVIDGIWLGWGGLKVVVGWSVVMCVDVVVYVCGLVGVGLIVGVSGDVMV